LTSPSSIASRNSRIEPLPLAPPAANRATTKRATISLSGPMANSGASAIQKTVRTVAGFSRSPAKKTKSHLRPALPRGGAHRGPQSKPPPPLSRHPDSISKRFTVMATPPPSPAMNQTRTAKRPSASSPLTVPRGSRALPLANGRSSALFQQPKTPQSSSSPRGKRRVSPHAPSDSRAFVRQAGPAPPQSPIGRPSLAEKSQSSPTTTRQEGSMRVWSQTFSPRSTPQQRQSALSCQTYQSEATLKTTSRHAQMPPPRKSLPTSWKWSVKRLTAASSPRPKTAKRAVAHPSSRKLPTPSLNPSVPHSRSDDIEATGSITTASHTAHTHPTTLTPPSWDTSAADSRATPQKQWSPTSPLISWATT